MFNGVSQRGDHGGEGVGRNDGIGVNEIKVVSSRIILNELEFNCND